MNDEKLKHRLIALASGYVIVFIIMVLLALCSCSTKKQSSIEKSTEKDVSASIVDNRHFARENLRDSVIITNFIYAKGDSVIVYRDRVHHTNSVRTDTVHELRVDTLIKTATVTKFTDREKQLSLWQRWRIGLADLALIALLLFIIYRYVRKKFFHP